jgi:transposase-like protein
MSQHFLLSAAARDYSIFDAARLTKAEAHHYLATIRWTDPHKPACPTCGVIDKHYFRPSRFQWRCKHCDAYFSVTTGTLFQDRKLPLTTILTAAFLYTTCANGVSASSLSRHVGVTPKTALVMLGKFREGIMRNANMTPLSGQVQIDGAHFCAKPRKPNRRRKVTSEDVMGRLSAPKSRRASKPPKTRMSRKSIERLKNRRVIMVARQISPQPGQGAERTIVTIALHENEAIGTAFAKRVIAPGSTIWTDESSAYTQLSSHFKHEIVNHSMEFVNDEGINDNQCESFNSRMRCSEYGVLHGFRPKYLADYLWEFAWREDTRKLSMGTRVCRLLDNTVHSGRSIWWRGYWQGQHRSGEFLFQLGHRETLLDVNDPAASIRTSFPRDKADS